LPSHDACEVSTATVGDLARPAECGVRVRQYASGSTIWTPSDRPDRIFRLKTGCVHIVQLDVDGAEYLYRKVAPGEIFGEMCFCAGRDEPHGTEARSLGRSEVWATSYEQFRRSVRSDASLVDSVLQTFCSRVSEAEQRVRILARRNARERLARPLVHLTEMRTPGGSDPGRDTSLTITHANLAAMSALSRPHVSILMTEFRRRRLVTYQRGSPLRISVAKLRRAFDIVEP
jgi:CRP/FNR family cyclic AMP-dependent transcriptional regulator